MELILTDRRTTIEKQSKNSTNKHDSRAQVSIDFLRNKKKEETNKKRRRALTALRNVARSRTTDDGSWDIYIMH